MKGMHVGRTFGAPALGAHVAGARPDRHRVARRRLANRWLDKYVGPSTIGAAGTRLSLAAPGARPARRGPAGGRHGRPAGLTAWNARTYVRYAHYMTVSQRTLFGGGEPGVRRERQLRPHRAQRITSWIDV